MTDHTFQGTPCRHGHGGLRYKLSRECVICYRLKAAAQRSNNPPPSSTPSKPPPDIEAVWQRLYARRGLPSKIAYRLGLRRQTVENWKYVPLPHVFRVASIANMPPEELRPDFFRHDPMRRHLFPRLNGPRNPAPTERSLEAVLPQ